MRHHTKRSAPVEAGALAFGAGQAASASAGSSAIASVSSGRPAPGLLPARASCGPSALKMAGIQPVPSASALGLAGNVGLLELRQPGDEFRCKRAHGIQNHGLGNVLEVAFCGRLPPCGHVEAHGLRQFCAGLVRRGTGVTTSTVEATHTASSRTSSSCDFASSAANSSALSSGKASPATCCSSRSATAAGDPASPGPCLPAGLALSGSRPAAGRGRSCPKTFCTMPCTSAASATCGCRATSICSAAVRWALNRCASWSDRLAAWAGRRRPRAPRWRLRLRCCRSRAAAFPACAAPWPRLRAAGRDE